MDHPNDVFLTNNSIIISDTDNARILMLNRLNWSFQKTIYPFFEFNNSNKKNVSYIFNTVEDNNGWFYSIVDNISLVKYNSTGLIVKTLDLPKLNLFDSAKFFDLAIDNTLAHSQILLKYLINDTLIKSGIYTIDDDLDSNSLNLIYSSIFIDESNTFSYQHSVPFITEWNENDTIKFIKFGFNESSEYTKLNEFYLKYNGFPFSFSQLINSFANFTSVYIFNLGLFNTSTITTNNLSYAGTFSNINQMGKFIPTKFAYDSNSDLVIMVSSTSDILIGINFFSIQKDNITTSFSLNTQVNPFFYYLLYFIPSFIILVIVVVIIFGLIFFKRWKKKKNELDD